MLIWLDFTEFYQVFISYAGLNWFSNGRLSNFNEESFDFEVSILNEYCNLIWFKLNVVIIRHVWKKSKIMKVNVMANDGQLSNCQYWLMALPYSIDLDHLRGQHGHKILDTARGGLFSSCCELTWPWRLTGQDQSNGVTPDRNTCGGDSSTANITKRFTLFHPSSVKYKKKKPYLRLSYSSQFQDLMNLCGLERTTEALDELLLSTFEMENVIIFFEVMFLWYSSRITHVILDHPG